MTETTVINVMARYRVAVMLCGALVVLPPAALGESNNTLVTIKVTVVAPPPCVINDDKPIEVEFGNVMTTQVDGKHYKMPVNYTLSCTDTTKNAMTMTIVGTATSFDTAALQSSKTGLGVRLLQDSNEVMINSPIKFTYPTNPVLYAIPVQQGGVALTGGEFTAAATMKVAYQ